jgi:hypothetical protein
LPAQGADAGQAVKEVGHSVGHAWQVIVHPGRDPVTGKRRNLTGTARTKREAKALRARLLTQADEGRRPATDATMAQLLEKTLSRPRRGGSER